MRAHWELEKATIARIREVKEQIETARQELERAQRDGDPGGARLQHGTLPELEKALEAANDELAEQQASRRMLKEEVDEEDVAEVVASWTGVPVSRLMEEEVEAPAHGGAPARAGRRPGLRRLRRRQRPPPARAGLLDPSRPSDRSSSWAPPGWGRPARPGAGRVHVRRRAMVRIDMSEYMERHAARA